MMNLADRWYVMLGKYYIAGLGQTYPGYGNSCIPVTPGLVITEIERRAMMFSSLAEAEKLSNRIGGRVIKVRCM